jgi:tyrosyl-tRNA synthetase
VHPMEAKKRLAWEIVSMFDGDEAADRAAAHFERVHQQRELPEEMPTHALAGPVRVVDVIFAAGFARSKSDARRLVQQGAVKLDGQPVSNVEAEIEAGAERVLQVGKRFFLRLTPGDKTA